MLVPSDLAKVMEGKKVTEYMTLSLPFFDFANTKIFHGMFYEPNIYSYYSRAIAASKPEPEVIVYTRENVRAMTTGDNILAHVTHFAKNPPCFSLWRLSNRQIVVRADVVHRATDGVLYQRYWVTRKGSMSLRLYGEVSYHWPHHRLVTRLCVHSVRCDPQGVVRVKALTKDT